METTVSIVVILVCIPLSFILCAMFYPLYAALRKIFYVPFARRRLIRSAIKENRVITAYLSDTERDCFMPKDGEPYHYNSRTLATYIFEYGGRKHIRRLTTRKELPNTIPVYYQKNPHKAQIQNSFGLAENPTWFLQYLVLVAIGVVILYVVGLDYVQGYVQNIL